jgi:hypothetical protein
LLGLGVARGQRGLDKILAVKAVEEFAGDDQVDGDMVHPVAEAPSPVLIEE